jgi:hypothetical protein
MTTTPATKKGRKPSTTPEQLAALRPSEAAALAALKAAEEAPAYGDRLGFRTISENPQAALVYLDSLADRIAQADERTQRKADSVRRVLTDLIGATYSGASTAGRDLDHEFAVEANNGFTFILKGL